MKEKQWSSHFTCRSLPKRNGSIWTIQSLVSSSISNTPKLKISQLSINWWIVNVWYNYTMACYSAITRNEPLIHAKIWVNQLSCLLLGIKSQTQETSYFIILFIWHLKRQMYRDREKISGCPVLELERAIHHKEAEGTFLYDGSVLYLRCEGGYITVCFVRSHGTVHWKGKFYSE